MEGPTTGGLLQPHRPLEGQLPPAHQVLSPPPGAQTVQLRPFGDPGSPRVSPPEGPAASTPSRQGSPGWPRPPLAQTPERDRAEAPRPRGEWARQPPAQARGRGGRARTQPSDRGAGGLASAEPTEPLSTRLLIARGGSASPAPAPCPPQGPRRFLPDPGCSPPGHPPTPCPPAPRAMVQAVVQAFIYTPGPCTSPASSQAAEGSRPPHQPKAPRPPPRCPSYRRQALPGGSGPCPSGAAKDPAGLAQGGTGASRREHLGLGAGEDGVSRAEEWVRVWPSHGAGGSGSFGLSPRSPSGASRPRGRAGRRVRSGRGRRVSWKRPRAGTRPAPSPCSPSPS